MFKGWRILHFGGNKQQGILLGYTFRLRGLGRKQVLDCNPLTTKYSAKTRVKRGAKSSAEKGERGEH
jgi:hypothetical protein